jgi:hypothetical protein
MDVDFLKAVSVALVAGDVDWVGFVLEILQGDRGLSGSTL